jgi:hypothetical protein
MDRGQLGQHQKQQLEQLVLICLDTATAMLDEYKHVIPFGIRVFKESDDKKMNCPIDNNKKADWKEQIEMVVVELRQFLETENIYATALVTGLETDQQKGIGLQIETEESSVLFVYPYTKQNDEWKIDEPIQTGQLFTRVFEK